MKIIDVHAHIYPDTIAQRAADSIGVFYDIPMHLNGTVHELLVNGEAAGISQHVVCSAAVTPNRVRSVNDYLIGVVQQFPDRMIGFGTMHAEFDDVEQELDRIKAAGLKGVKLHPDFQHFCLDDEKAIAMFQAMADRNLPALIHTGDQRYPYSEPRRMARVLDKVPHLKPIWAAGACGMKRGMSWRAAPACGWIRPRASMPSHPRRAQRSSAATVRTACSSARIIPCGPRRKRCRNSCAFR